MSARHTPVVTTRMPRAQRRAQIANAAATVFMRGGFDGTSMDDVARQAGVTRLIVYRIFETKEDLYRSVLDLVMDDLARSFDALDRDGFAPDDPDRTIAGTVLTVARRHPDAFRLLWRHAAHEPPFRQVAALFKATVIEYAIGFFAAIDDPLMRTWTAESVASHLWESVCLWLDDGDPARDRECSMMITEGIRSLVDRWTELGGAAR